MAKQLKPSLNRHRVHCTVCTHERCADIESDFIEWKSPAVIAADYGLADRMNVYRHAHALSLFGKRQRNIRAALEKIISGKYSDVMDSQIKNIGMSP